MKGIRFYEELTDKNRKTEKSKGTVIAVFYKQRWHGDKRLHFVAAHGLFHEPNSPCASGVTNDLWLVEKCRRISEAKAREIHPKLFEYLDD